MKFLTKKGIFEVRDNQIIAGECYVSLLRVRLLRVTRVGMVEEECEVVRFKPSEPIDEVMLNIELKQPLKFGLILPEGIKSKLSRFLQEYEIVFCLESK